MPGLKTPRAAGASPVKSSSGLGAQERIALLATAFLFPLAGATLMLPWLLGLRISMWVKEGRLYWVRSPFDVPTVAFVSLAFAAGVFSSQRGIALGFWILLALAFVVVLQAVLHTLHETPTFVRSLHKAFALGTLVAAIYGLALFFIQHLDRAQLLTLGPQAFGFGLMAGIFLALPLLQEPSPWPLISLLTLTASSMAIIASFNRAALYGLAAGGLTYLWLERCKLPLRLFAAAALSLVLGLLIAVATPSILQALGHALNFTGLVRGPIEGSMALRKTFQFLFSVAGNSDRISIWRADLRVIRQYPWFGVGLGAFGSFVRQYSADLPGGNYPPGTPPHSLYLNLAAEVGIPGALAFLALPVLAIRQALRQRDVYHTAEIACMAGMLAAEVRDGILMGYHMSLGFILILGMMVAFRDRAHSGGSR